VDRKSAIDSSTSRTWCILVYKLKSPRLEDRADIVELVKSGVDVDACRRYLSQHAPALVDEFDEAVAHARAEEE